jgi:hypothetical protein
MQTFLKPFKKLAGRVLLGLKLLALRARGFKPKPNKTLAPARFLNSTNKAIKTSHFEREAKTILGFQNFS